MIVSTKSEALDYIIAFNPNDTPEKFLVHHLASITQYPVNIAYWGDEKTGSRFGSAFVRVNRNPKKLGGGGRNGGSRKAYQLWIWDYDPGDLR